MEKLLELSEIKSEMDSNSTTFLNVIGRTYDEDLTSRIVAHVLAKDKKLVKALIDEYVNRMGCDDHILDDIDTYEIAVICEKYMGIGRADIFVELKNNDGVAATITIENKIYTWEHDSQTTTYYKWVCRYYKNSFNMFFYLRPSFNISEAECDKYINLTYAELSDFIEIDDHITRDFKEHIKNNLGVKNMELSEKQIDIINNYDKVKEELDDIIDRYMNKQNGIIEKIKKEWENSYGAINFEIVKEKIGVGSFRLYRDKWYLKDEYYFYVEIRFFGGKLDNIAYQKTVKDYRSKTNKTPAIVTFIEDLKEIFIQEEGHFHVWGEENYSSKDWTNSEWEDEFVKASVTTLKAYVDSTDEIFEKFEDFKRNL